MKKITVFGLGLLAGALGICAAIDSNAKNGRVLLDNDTMVIKEAGSRFANINVAEIYYKD